MSVSRLAELFDLTDDMPVGWRLNRAAEEMLDVPQLLSMSNDPMRLSILSDH
jgi:hypothetical protein